MQLESFASIVAGYHFRTAVEPDSHGDAYVFQAKDIIQGEFVESCAGLTRIQAPAPASSAYVQKGDILLVSKSVRSAGFKSCVYVGPDKNIIASSSVFIIRVTDPQVLPAYVSLYLNTPPAQTMLLSISSGSYVITLSRSVLAEKANIPIPPLKEQRKLVDLHINMTEQLRIMFRKSELTRSVVETAFTTLTNTK